jgi:3-oxoacyl-[acyl-carrier-protein] synthase-1
VARWALSSVFVPELLRRSGLSFASVRTFEAGHAGMFLAAAEASAMLAAGHATSVLVAGVDSWVDPDRLVELDRAYRAKSNRNVDGFVPGEAATALLLEPPSSSRTPLAILRAVATGREPAASTGDRQSTGVGLCDAVRSSLSGLPGPVGWVLCDLNGESYRGFEWGILRARLASRFEGDPPLCHPAECYGDVGAASGGALVAVACSAFRRGWAPAAHALAWCASDDAARAAAFLEAPRLG